MLNQTDSKLISLSLSTLPESETLIHLQNSFAKSVVRFLSQEPPPPQHVAFSILHAYVFSKSRRGNLPSETLSKLLSVQRKLLIKRGGKPFGVDSPIARAFEAMRIQMLIVNKKWLTNGVEAFGPLVSF